MFDLRPIGTADLIAILSAAIALAAFAAAFWYSRRSRNDSLRVEKSNAYLNLEVASSEVFKYDADHSETLAPYQESPPDDAERNRRIADRKNARIAENLYYQSLNLFEVCARFRRQQIIEPEVFASWVTWFYSTLDDWYFRYRWPEIRCNYTDDVRDIFDLGLRIFEDPGTGDEKAQVAERKARFYAWVGQHMQCTEISDWPDNIRMEAERPAPRPSPRTQWLIRNGWRRPPTAERRRISSLEPSGSTTDISATAKSSTD